MKIKTLQRQITIKKQLESLENGKSDANSIDVVSHITNVLLATMDDLIDIKFDIETAPMKAIKSVVNASVVKAIQLFELNPDT